MKKLFLSLALGLLFAFGVNAQNAKGDWYIGSGDIANVAWTDWSVSPLIGYAFTDALVGGVNISQAVDADIDLDFYSRYFWNGVFIHAGLNGLEFDSIELGLGKQFTVRNNVYVDPCVVYNAGNETINLTLGFGFKF